MKTTMKPISVFIPITRIDEVERVVEGYGFTQEVVEGEGGVRLKRASMEEATPDYMQWGAVREMHQPVAAGTAIGVEWDGTGAFLRAKVVDDAAWKKVQERVYKGFSVGVQALVMRGKDVEKARWIETSLVDRPKDPGAVIMAFRAADCDPNAEYEVEVIEEERGDGPLSFTQKIAADQLWSEGWEALDALYSVLIDIAYSDAEGREALARESIQQFADYIAPMVAGQTIKARSADSAVSRVLALTDERQQILERAAAAESELARVQGELDSATERVKTLEAQPAPQTQPVRFPEAFERTFEANKNADTDAPGAEALRAEYAELSKVRASDIPTQQNTLLRMGQIKGELARIGESL